MQRFDREPIGNGIGFRNRSPKETENSYYSSDNPINATRGGTGALGLTVHIGRSVHISASGGSSFTGKRTSRESDDR
jgi:hypothetical protein